MDSLAAQRAEMKVPFIYDFIFLKVNFTAKQQTRMKREKNI